MHEGPLNKELLKGFSMLLLEVKLILKSLMVLKRPGKATSAVGVPGRRNCWRCEIPSLWHHPPGDKTQVWVVGSASKEAQKAAAALAVLFLHSSPALVPAAQSSAAVFCPL